MSEMVSGIFGPDIEFQNATHWPQRQRIGSNGGYAFNMSSKARRGSYVVSPELRLI